MESNPYSSPSANLFGSSSITATEAVSEATVAHLKKTKPWVRLISAMTYFAFAMMLLGGIGLSIMGSTIAQNMPEMEGMPPGFNSAFFAGIGIPYAVMSFLYLYPAMALWKYANRIGDLVKSGSVAHLESALSEQRGFWTYVGVITLISLCFMVLFFGLILVAAIVGAAAGAKGG
jgi:hypothetical protein